MLGKSEPRPGVNTPCNQDSEKGWVRSSSSLSFCLSPIFLRFFFHRHIYMMDPERLIEDREKRDGPRGNGELDSVRPECDSEINEDRNPRGEGVAVSLV